MICIVFFFVFFSSTIRGRGSWKHTVGLQCAERRHGALRISYRIGAHFTAFILSHFNPTLKVLFYHVFHFHLMLCFMGMWLRGRVVILQPEGWQFNPQSSPSAC